MNADCGYPLEWTGFYKGQYDFLGRSCHSNMDNLGKIKNNKGQFTKGGDAQ